MKNKKRHLREAGTIFMNGLFLKNPLLIGALGLFPAIAGAYSVRNAAAMGILIIAMSLPSGILMCIFGELVPQWVRPGVALALMALIFVPAASLVSTLMPGELTALGMLAGLMICNSMALSRLNDYAPSHIGLAVLADALGCTIGYTIILLAVGAFREALLTGKVEGLAVTGGKGVALPFFGLICLGFLAALAQWLNERRANAAKRSVKRS